MDLTQSIIPKSDQLNSDDLVAAPVTATITEVRAGNAEQPVEVHLAEFPGRPYKPSKSMRRVMVQAWGADASAYAGRRITLFRNPEIRFGGATVGGIEISHMSHLAKRLTVSLMVTRGKRKPFSVEPLVEQAPKQQAPAQSAIPEHVVTATEKAKADGNLPEYAEYLKGQNAPQHILDYVAQADVR